MENKKIKTAKVAVVAVLETATTGTFLYKFQIAGSPLSIPKQKAMRGKIRANLSLLCGAYCTADKLNASSINSAIAELRTFVRNTYIGESISPATFSQMDARNRVYYTGVVNSLKKRGVDFVK